MWSVGSAPLAITGCALELFGVAPCVIFPVIIVVFATLETTIAFQVLLVAKIIGLRPAVNGYEFMPQR